MFSNWKEKAKNRKKGFSFMEVVMAMALIIAMSVGVFFAVNQAQHTRKMAQMNNDLDAIVAGAETYEALSITSSVPANLEALKTGLKTSESIDGAAHENFVRSVKADGDNGTFKDPWGNEYNYDPDARTVSCTPKDTDGKTDLPVVTRYF